MTDAEMIRFMLVFMAIGLWAIAFVLSLKS